MFSISSLAIILWGLFLWFLFPFSRLWILIVTHFISAYVIDYTMHFVIFILDSQLFFIFIHAVNIFSARHYFWHIQISF